jgi:hypothetical protein
MDFVSLVHAWIFSKVEYRGHGIHLNTLVSFMVLIFRMRDKKVKERLNTDSTVQIEGVSSSQENIIGFWF